LLGAEERREILDYLAGRGLSMEMFIKPDAMDGEWGRDGALRLRAPPEGSAGWGGRINRAIISFVKSLRSMDEKEAVKALSKHKGIGPKKATSFYRSLLDENALTEIRKGNLDLFRGSAGIWKLLLVEYLDDEGVKVGFSLDEERGETDEPVTADIRRLIRCPGSLHGGSGFRVTPLTVRSLEAFDPLQDAVVFGDNPVSLEIEKPFSTQMRGESFRLSEGRTEVPLHVAVFLLARGVAYLGERPPETQKSDKFI
jgi:DNA primase small subunit